MDKTQTGRAGELALAFYGLVTSGGRLELFTPVADDDHVDLIAGLKGGLPVLGIQVKTTDALDKGGLVEAEASFPAGQVREDPAFLYAILLLDSVAIKAAWVVPSPDFNRLAYHAAAAGDREALEFRASLSDDDRFAPFRVEPLQLGPVLVARIESSGAVTPPDWLTALQSLPH